MVPHSTMQNTTILDESERVKELLVDVQKQIEAVTRKAAADLLKDGRKGWATTRSQP